jgi:GH15 family glucan-1,4-alpha-glucosidase
MTSRIEDYALIGDCHGAGLVSRDGSLDWLCVPRFDSSACFAAILGDERNGRWQIGPASKVVAKRRAYRDHTLVLETIFETDTGEVAVIDCMPAESPSVSVVRVVEGRRGRVDMQMDLRIRFEYGSVVPWVESEPGKLSAIAGADRLVLRTPVTLKGEDDFRTSAAFSVAEGERVPFVMSFHASYLPEPDALEADHAIATTEAHWTAWTAKSNYKGKWFDAVQRSLVVLKALTYKPSGGMVAAPSTSLPEKLGGVRNWDYRYCWLRDASITLNSLMACGYLDEAHAWRNWLLRAIAGDPAQLQIMYGVTGSRRVTETELQWLPGHEGSKPVRIGNGAHGQRQLDVFGELMDAMHLCRVHDIEGSSWSLECNLLGFLESEWRLPDEGIWEVRGPKQHFTHSKVMAWVAFDRAVKAIEQFGHEGPLERWQQIRSELHEQICEQGFSVKKQAFAQAYGSEELDASLLLIPLVGFLPPSDPRVQSTLAAIEKELVTGAFVARYRTQTDLDHLPEGEGAFLPCSFWYVQNLALQGRHEEAERLFEELLGARNDLGLLAEEYDPREKRQLGNFPQAFSHLALIDCAHALFVPKKSCADRRGAERAAK